MTKTFTILGEPKGKQRPKFTSIAGHPRAITPQQTAHYENLVRMEYQAQCGNFYFEDGKPVFILIDSFMAAPQSTSKKKLKEMLEYILRPLKKSDWDNIGKLICDSLNGIAYHDDAQVVDGRVRKFYAVQPKTQVFISDHPINTADIDEQRGIRDAC